MNKRKGIISIVTILIFIGLLSIISAISVSALRLYETQSLQETNTKLYYAAESGAEWGLQYVKKYGIFTDKKIIHPDNHKVEVQLTQIKKSADETEATLISKSINEEKERTKQVKITFTLKNKQLVVKDCGT